MRKLGRQEDSTKAAPGCARRHYVVAISYVHAVPPYVLGPEALPDTFQLMAWPFGSYYATRNLKGLRDPFAP